MLVSRKADDPMVHGADVAYEDHIKKQGVGYIITGI